MKPGFPLCCTTARAFRGHNHEQLLGAVELGDSLLDHAPGLVAINGQGSHPA